MHVLLLATWLALPAYPLNPVVQDTMAWANVHMTVGLSGPNGLAGPGPEFSLKYEMRFVHPIVVRTAFDYRTGDVKSVVYPGGVLHGATVSADILYYKGTHKLTGYLGLGAVYTLHRFDLSRAAIDSLRAHHQIAEVGFDPTFGLRITMGLRFHRIVSLEIGITEARPNLTYVRRYTDQSYSLRRERIRLSDARVTLGYLWSLSGR